MIESRYWKEDLLKHANRLKPLKKPSRWSEKIVVNFEKEIVVSFFYVRKLFETNNISNKSRDYRAEVYSCADSGKRITKRNQQFIDDVYDTNNEKKVRKKIIFLANQLIHSCTIYPYRNKDRNWGGVYVCSDFERNKAIYRIPIEEIISIFNLVGNDYLSSVIMTFNENTEDYDVRTK